MTSRRTLAAILCLAIASVACSEERKGSATTSTPTTAVPTTSVASGVTTSKPSASTTTTATTTPSSTTSTIPLVDLELSSKGLGDALFGAAPDGVIAYFKSILKAPTADTGWVKPSAHGVVCPGTVIRFVSWHDLTLMFTDNSPQVNGLRHFASYVYGPMAGKVIDPFGLSTEGSITVGDTVADLKAVYPKVVIHPKDQLSGPSFFIEEGLSGFLSGTKNTDHIVSFVGGFTCGE